MLPPFIKRIPDLIRPHQFFALAALLLGVVYNIVTPPLQAPDEYDHFRRVYHIAEGHFLPEKKDQRLGGEMPTAFKEFVLPYRLAANNLRYTLSKDVYVNAMKMPFDDSEKEFNDFPNTSYYSPISYIPQALAVYVAKKLRLPFLAIYFAGRIAMYLIWMLIMFFLIKRMPIGKWLFTFIVLLPMNVYIGNSYSADAVTNILSFVFLVLVLQYTFDDKGFSGKRMLILTLLGVLLALSKVVYIGLIFIFLIIPLTKFKSKIHYLSAVLLLFACSFGAAYLWSNLIVQYFTPYSDYHPDFRNTCCLSNCADMEAQKEHILSHGTYFLEVIYQSLFRHPYTYLAGYIGSFGNNDIPLPRWVLIISYVFIILLALTEKNKVSLSLRQKAVLFLSSFLAFVLLLLSQHLTWDCVGEGIVDVVQGRYLIPLFPLLFLGLSNASSLFRLRLSVIVVLVVILNNYIIMHLNYKRYLKEEYVHKIEFECGAEQVNSKGLFTTTNPKITLEGQDSKNDSVAFTGKSSVLLSEASPFSFIYKFKNLNYGDLVEVSAWQKGTGAQMVFTGKGTYCGEFYYPNWVIAYKGPRGWNRMHYVFTMGLNCILSDSVNVTFFLWNPSKTKTYVDDLKFSIRKFDDNYLDSKDDLFH
jgi:uncharacterized membrane protein